MYKETTPALEVLRYKEANKLRRYLDDLVQKHSKRTPSNAFERWLLSQKFIDNGEDPLFPSSKELNTGLLHELERIRVPLVDAEQICLDLAKTCSDIANRILKKAATKDEESGRNSSILMQ